MNPRPRIALVSIGIGLIQRGFERYFGDLHGVLSGHADVTLYKSAGETSAHQRIPRFLDPAKSLTRLLPLGVVGEGAEFRLYKHDCLAFALTLLPELNAYDVVHVIDFPLAVALHRLRKVFPFRPKLIFTNGSCMPHQFVPASAHVHHVAKLYFEDALQWGLPQNKVTLVPCGFHAGRFETNAARQELRARHGIAENTTVILAVCAVKKMHKRVDHIIEEVSRIPGDILLWIDGAPEDAAIPELARARLGSRCRITHVPSGELGELYHLADVMVHAALVESFGLSVVEGLSTGLPVLAHDSAHFEWLTGGRELLLDMSAPGALSARLEAMVADRAQRARRMDRAESIRARFDWSRLARDYADMYRRVAGVAPA